MSRAVAFDWSRVACAVEHHDTSEVDESIGGSLSAEPVVEIEPTSIAGSTSFNWFSVAAVGHQPLPEPALSANATEGSEDDIVAQDGLVISPGGTHVCSASSSCTAHTSRLHPLQSESGQRDRLGQHTLPIGQCLQILGFSLSNLRAGLHVANMHSLVAAPEKGLLTSSPLSAGLLSAVHTAASVPAEHLDKDYITLEEAFLLSGDKFHMSSTVARAEQLGLQRVAVQQ
eukprot:6485337-Amphidinium_carterae.1